jgi:alanyl-tRNA synthetase
MAYGMRGIFACNALRIFSTMEKNTKEASREVNMNDWEKRFDKLKVVQEIDEWHDDSVLEEIKSFIRSLIKEEHKKCDETISKIMEETKRDIEEAKKEAVEEYDRKLEIKEMFEFWDKLGMEMESKITAMARRNQALKELGIKE